MVRVPGRFYLQMYFGTRAGRSDFRQCLASVVKIAGTLFIVRYPAARATVGSLVREEIWQQIRSD
jgi:hypothetical protein